MVTIVNRDAYPVAWREAGSGEPALFLHGLGGSRTSWDPQLSALGAARRCVAWDMPGYGRSSGSPTTLEDLADAAAGLISELGSGPADVVGLSMGGMVAQHLTLRHPELVRSLALLDTSPAFGMDGTTAQSWLQARLGPMEAGATVEDIAPAVIGGIAGPNATAEQLASAVAAMRRIPDESLKAACAALVHHDVRDRLAQIDVPVIVLIGSADEETPLAYSRALAEAIAGAQLHIVEGAGHLSNIESPEQVNALLAQFWANHEEHVA